MAMNTADLSARGQNIGLLEGARGRTQADQMAAQQEDLARAQMAQQQSQFTTSLEEDRARREEAAKQAAEDRLYGLIGSGIGAAGSIGGGIVGKLV